MTDDPLKTILVVEDEENDVFFLERAMRKAGINNPIHVASTGEEAMAYLAGEGKYADRKLHPLPSMIFLDIHLPGICGLDLLAWLRKEKNFDPIMVILLTSSKEVREISTAYDLGVNSYLVKPPTVDSLMVLINAFDQYKAEFGENGGD